MPPKVVKNEQEKEELEKRVEKVEKVLPERKVPAKHKKRLEKMSERFYKKAKTVETQAQKFHEKADVMQKKKMEKYYLMLDHAKHLRMLGDVAKRAANSKLLDAENFEKELEEHRTKINEIKSKIRPTKEKKVEVVEEKKKTIEEAIAEEIAKRAQPPKIVIEEKKVEEKPKEKPAKVKIEAPKIIEEEFDEDKEAKEEARGKMMREFELHDRILGEYMDELESARKFFEPGFDKLSKKEKDKIKESIRKVKSILERKYKSRVDNDFLDKLTKKDKENFESTMKKKKAESKEVKPHLVKGSKEAKEHMAKIRGEKVGGGGKVEEKKPESKMSNLEKRALAVAKKIE